MPFRLKLSPFDVAIAGWCRLGVGSDPTTLAATGRRGVSQTRVTYPPSVIPTSTPWPNASTKQVHR